MNLPVTALAATDSDRTLVAIPARWGSTRFPGKPLHLIAGKPLVQHVWERCQQCRNVDEVIIATDDARIAEAAASFGAKCALTAPDHPSGTDRIAEAARAFPDHRVIINVQGDEPLISPALIDELATVLVNEPQVRMITAAAPVLDPAHITDPNIVKVVFDTHGDSLYFSRSPLPFIRDASAGARHYRHLGIYGFQRGFLFQFVAWPPSRLERAEALEQLRALENGVRLRVVLTDEISPGVDTPEQAAAVERQLASAVL
ncbi:MAG TPA: 3-deoxy-manno-octulosonate cytidylyltransferase [Verrucomicrobiales bacterium]|nr:3-deoxy-manno-octulosonate cytidylyltransferase [Verrucomicrobiales bacterium]HRJ08400.1 3-deoxy-manno-octulosonate cytidylyltransferase [Prosthecobacter sp.]HRK15574.1 3-deoxy-manno-octulosonate cytidylyltransferase [Prosthecobacter sp.]